MAEVEKQVVEGARRTGLIETFFKSLEGAFEKAAEYQKHNGILERVTKLTLVDDSDKEYNLTVTMSPVKDKPEIFYVTAETDAPGLNLDSINKKAVRLNDRTEPQFEKLVSDLVEKANLRFKDDEVENVDDDEEDEGEEERYEERPEELTAEQNDTVDDFVEEQEDRFEDAGDNFIVVNNDDEQFQMKFIFDHKKRETYMALKIYLVSKDERVSNEKSFKFDLFVKQRKEYVFSVGGDRFEEFLVNTIEDYMRAKGLEYATDSSTNSLVASTSLTKIRATFVRASEGHRIELRAISAKSDLAKAMSTIYDVVDDEEFLDSLTPEPQSFEIVEYEDGYDVNPIDKFDTCCIVRKIR